MAARLRRLAELREGLARRDRVQSRRELEFAEAQLKSLDASHAQAEEELLGSDEPLTGAHMRLLQDGRLSHRGWRRMREAVVNERSGIGRSFTERPYVKFETRCIRLAEEAP